MCHQVARQNCDKTAGRVCHDIPREVCQESCTSEVHIPHQQCTKIPREVCSDLPKKVRQVKLSSFRDIYIARSVPPFQPAQKYRTRNVGLFLSQKKIVQSSVAQTFQNKNVVSSLKKSVMKISESSVKSPTINGSGAVALLS